MTSKTSFFDREVFRRSLKTAALPAILYTLLWVVLLPSSLPAELESVSKGYAFQAQTLQSAIYRGCTYAGPLSIFYGLALAWLLYHWLFRISTAYRYGALPIRREALFTTSFITGLLAFLVPHLVVALATTGVTAALGYAQPAAAMQWFAAVSLECLFFFSFAVFLIMIVGQMAAMPVLYVILNCTVIVIYLISCSLLQTFVYGMPDATDRGAVIMAYFSPIVALFARLGPHGSSYSIEYPVVELVNMWYAYALGAAGAAFAVLALLLFRKRELERCGDVIAVKSLRPVFLYAFTFGCALVIGILIADTVNLDTSSRNMWPILLFSCVGAFLGYFGAQMMLKKTVRVFSRGWLGFGVCCGVLLLVLGGVKLDLTGYVRRVPEAQEVASVGINNDSHGALLYETDDETAIKDVIALHENILGHQDDSQAIKNSGRDWNSRYVSIGYRLKNGRELTRTYRLYMPANNTDPENPLYQFTGLYNSTPFVLTRCTPDMEVTPDSVATCGIFGWDAEGKEPHYLNLSSSDAYEFYHDCVLPDLADSSMGRLDFGYDGAYPEEAGTVVVSEEDLEKYEEEEQYFSCHFDFTFRNPDGTTRGGCSLTVTPDAKRCIAYLEKLGFNLGPRE